MDDPAEFKTREDLPGQDRRQFRRVPIDVSLFYRINRPPELQVAAPGDSCRTGAVDISEGGLGFISDQEILPPSELGITFHLVFRERENPTITALAQVRYCRSLQPVRNPPAWRIGASFTKIDDADRHLIAEYVRLSSSRA